MFLFFSFLWMLQTSSDTASITSLFLIINAAKCWELYSYAEGFNPEEAVAHFLTSEHRSLWKPHQNLLLWHLQWLQISLRKTVQCFTVKTNLESWIPLVSTLWLSVFYILNSSVCLSCKLRTIVASIQGATRLIYNHILVMSSGWHIQ